MRPITARYNIAGNVYGRLTVEEFAGIRSGIRYWTCVCICGKIKVIAGVSLKRGRTKSCGCWNNATRKLIHIKHGFYNTPTYDVWVNMKARCLNSKHPSYDNYGGRGITVSDSWLSSFINFLADMGTKPNNLSLDRIDNDLGYTKENCRWATTKQQSNNRRPKYKKKKGIVVYEPNRFVPCTRNL